MRSYEEQKARIARLNLMDDQFFQKVAENPECCEDILRIILQMPDLRVISNQIERTIPNVTNKSVKLDLICEDADGNIFNVEVQKANDTDHQKRVRYNMACVDTLSAEKGTDYADLPDVYYKETPGGEQHLKSVWDEVREEGLKEGRKEERKEMAIALLKKKVFPLAEIAELTKLPLSEVEALQKAI